MISIRFSSFLLYRNCKRLREFKEIEISSKAVEVTVNKTKGNSKDFCLEFRPRIRSLLMFGVLMFLMFLCSPVLVLQQKRDQLAQLGRPHAYKLLDNPHCKKNIITRNAARLKTSRP
jgi:hypothetical protein